MEWSPLKPGRFTTPTTAFDADSAVDYLVVHRSSKEAVDRVRAVATADASAWSR